jgi:WD40 repeat protein
MRIAAAAEFDGTSSKRSLWILDANGREPPRELCDRIAKSGAMSFAGGGERLAVAVDKTICIYRTDRWELLHRVPALASITSICFSPDDRRLAAVGYDGVVILADPATGTQVLQLGSLAPNRPNDFACDARVAFSADGNWLVSTNWTGTLVVRNGAPFAMVEDQAARDKR